MWTFPQEQNSLYITHTKLPQLIWVNSGLLWATQCQARVQVHYTHLKNEYRVVRLILELALRKTLPMHMSMTALHVYALLMPCSTKYRCNSYAECLAAA